jgi:hypothetical protein
MEGVCIKTKQEPLRNDSNSRVLGVGRAYFA